MNAATAPSTTRTLLIVLGVVVVLALLWLVAQPLLFPADEAATPPVATPEPAPTDAPDAPAEDGALDEVVPAVTYEIFLDRDPFEPVREPVVAAPPATDDGLTPPAQPDDGTTPAADGNGDGNGTPPPGDGLGTTNGSQGCHGEEEVVCDGRVVTLLDITEDNGRRVAVIQVDTVAYTVAQGDVFAENFFLRQIDEDSVIIVYGDGHRIHLDEGTGTMK